MEKKSRRFWRTIFAAGIICGGPLSPWVTFAHDLHHFLGIRINTHGTLVGQTRTDVAYPEEFDRIIVSSDDGNGHDIYTWSETWTPPVGTTPETLARGGRILERGGSEDDRDGLHDGDIRLNVAMMKGPRVVVSRPVRLHDIGDGTTVVTVLVTKERPVIVFEAPRTIFYGTALGATQLNERYGDRTVWGPNGRGRDERRRIQADED